MHQRKFGVGEEGDDQLGHDVVVMTHRADDEEAGRGEVAIWGHLIVCVSTLLYQQNSSLPLRKMPRDIHNFDGKEDECDVQ